MITPRIIPCLLLYNHGLVKGIRFKDHKYIGDPVNAVKIFSAKEADELVLLDITASKENRIVSIPFVEKIADECYMPFAIGGGIRSIEHIRSLLHAGAEKVVINTSAVKNSELIKDAANIFGSQSILVSVDVKKNWKGEYQIYTQCGTESIQVNFLEFLVKMEKYGAGEILITSIDRDGTMEGYDLDIIKIATDIVTIPVIACGGAGTLQDFGAVVHEAQASAAAAGSMFVFHGKKRGVLINYPSRVEIDDIFKDEILY